MSAVIFTLLRLAPGDIVDILFSTAGYVSPSEKQAIMKELGIDRPYWVQYLDWIRQMLTGDLGKSYLRPAGLADHPAARAGHDRARRALHALRGADRRAHRGHQRRAP